VVLNLKFKSLIKERVRRNDKKYLKMEEHTITTNNIKTLLFYTLVKKQVMQENYIEIKCKNCKQAI
jgi:hypothetical protein